MKRRGHKRLRRFFNTSASGLPTITLTPLIDTVLVLLVIFMVTTPSKTPLPSQAAPSQIAHDEARKAVEHNRYPLVTIGANGALFINETPVNFKLFQTALEQELKTIISGKKIIGLRVEPGASQALVKKVKGLITRIKDIGGVYEDY
jgi:biopolymer transport protein ExbD